MGPICHRQGGHSGCGLRAQPERARGIRATGASPPDRALRPAGEGGRRRARRRRQWPERGVGRPGLASAQASARGGRGRDDWRRRGWARQAARQSGARAGSIGTSSGGAASRLQRGERGGGRREAVSQRAGVASVGRTRKQEARARGARTRALRRGQEQGCGDAVVHGPAGERARPQGLTEEKGELTGCCRERGSGARGGGRRRRSGGEADHHGSSGRRRGPVGVGVDAVLGGERRPVGRRMGMRRRRLGAARRRPGMAVLGAGGRRPLGSGGSGVGRPLH